MCEEGDDGVMKKNEDAWHFRFSVSTDELSAWGWKGINVTRFLTVFISSAFYMLVFDLVYKSPDYTD